jgi:hypothetical protein
VAISGLWAAVHWLVAAMIIDDDDDVDVDIDDDRLSWLVPRESNFSLSL